MITIEGVKRIVWGKGSIERLPDEIREIGAEKILWIMDKGLSGLQIKERVEEIFKRERIEYVPYFEITPEPSPQLADRGTEIAKEESVECVIGIGGGSTLDVAKAVAALVNNPGKATEYIGLNLLKSPGLPSIMIPTTAGTGSEVTFTSVFTMREEKRKGGINSPYLYPTVAIVDPELTYTLPPFITAYTGMDALTHAIESFTSKSSHFLSRPISFEAIKLIWENIRYAVEDGSDINARENMMKGSLMAGLGLSMAGVGAVHALAYPLGSLFDIPHGIANAVMLPYVLRYNIEHRSEEYQGLIPLFKRDGGCSVYDIPFFIQKMLRDIGLPSSLKELKVPEEAIPDMTDAAIKVERPMKNNPISLDRVSVESIYRNAMFEKDSVGGRDARI